MKNLEIVTEICICAAMVAVILKALPYNFLNVFNPFYYYRQRRFQSENNERIENSIYDIKKDIEVMKKEIRNKTKTKK